MMFHILLPLFMWLGRNNGLEYSGCDNVQQLAPGKEYLLYNPRYPQNYPPGASCRWVLTSDRPLKMTCETFNMPFSEECSRDALIIHEVNVMTGHRYCGSGNFTVVSKAENLTITLSTSPTSPGGRFLCSVKTQTTEEEDSNCRCGWKNPTRIVGGTDAGTNEYPMMAALIDTFKNSTECGATIINEKQVLTAAHCMLHPNISTLAVLVGDHDGKQGVDANSSKLYNVESVVVHDSYNSVTNENDIALVTVKGEIAFSQQVGPACLPFQHASGTFGGSFVEILGWGLTALMGGRPEALQKAQVSIITNVRCRRDFPAVTAKQICTRGEKGVDACTYDNGGPILWQNPTTRRIVEIGIISAGNLCATNRAGVNTRVGAFIDWIVARTPPGITYCEIE